MKILLTTILLVLTYITGNAAAQEVTDKERIEKDIIGTWGYSDDGGKTFWGFVEYLSNSTILAWGTLYEYDAYDPDKPGYNIEAKYYITETDGVPLSCLKIVNSSPPDMYDIDEFFCDEVLELNSQIFLYKRPSGEVKKIYRIGTPIS